MHKISDQRSAISDQRSAISTWRGVASVILVCVALVAGPLHAEASNPSPLKADCGASVADALKAARAALAKADGGQDRAALACLLVATSGLADDLQAYEAGKQQSGVVHFPVHLAPNQDARKK